MSNGMVFYSSDYEALTGQKPVEDRQVEPTIKAVTAKKVVTADTDGVAVKGDKA